MNIIWTEAASISYQEYLSFLSQSWNEEVVNIFRQLLQNKIEGLKKFPKGCTYYTRSKNIRRCLIHKNVSLYYHYFDDTLLLLLIWDNRRNPDELLARL